MTDLADELKKLNELLANGTLTSEEFAQAKANLLANSKTSSNLGIGSFLEDQLAELRDQNELARIDREWDVERRQYEIVRRSGRTFIPTVGTGIVTGFVGGIFGVFLTAVGLTIQSVTSWLGYRNSTVAASETIIIVVGLVWTIVAVGKGAYHCVLAQNHKVAYAAYQTRRRNSLTKFREPS